MVRGVLSRFVVFPERDLEYDALEHEYTKFKRYIEQAAHNLRSTTLNIFTWPKEYETGQTKSYRRVKDLSLARLASDVFECHRQYEYEEDDFGTEEHLTNLQVVRRTRGRRTPGRRNHCTRYTKRDFDKGSRKRQATNEEW